MCDIIVGCRVDNQSLSKSFVMLYDITFCQCNCLSVLFDFKIFLQTSLSCA